MLRFTVLADKTHHSHVIVKHYCTVMSQQSKQQWPEHTALGPQHSVIVAAANPVYLRVSARKFRIQLQSEVLRINRVRFPIMC